MNFYEEITGLDPEMTLEEIKGELLRQEKVWIKRQITAPEKATKMLAVLIDAKKAFADETSRRAYDKELAESKNPPPAADPLAARRAEFYEWIEKTNQYLNQENQVDMAGQAFEKALSCYTPCRKEEAGLYLYGVDICNSRQNYEGALRYINQGLMLDDTSMILYWAKTRCVCLLALLETQPEQGAHLGRENSYCAIAHETCRKALSLARQNDDADMEIKVSAQLARLYYLVDEETQENKKEARRLALLVQNAGQGELVKDVLDTMELEQEDIRQEKEYLEQLASNTAAFQRKQAQNRENGAIGKAAFAIGVVLSFLLAGAGIGTVPITLGTVAAGVGIGAFCFYQPNKNGPVAAGILWAFIFSFISATKRYTALGYSAASAAAVGNLFKVNMILLIVVAVAAKIAGKRKQL